MTGVRIVIDDDQIAAALSGLAARGSDLGAAMHAIGAAMLAKTQQRFQRQAGPDGNPWTPLRPRTAARRIGRRRRGQDNILRVSNRLYSSLTYEATEAAVSVGSNAVYAAIHQLGGTIKAAARQQTINLVRRNGRTRFAKAGARGAVEREVSVGAHTITIPARPYLGVDEADRAEILAIIADHLEVAP